MRVPLVPRGAGTGYTGGAVPLHGGVVVSLERLNRILEIDEESLLAVVEPAVITGDLQAAVEARGLFYPPDPAEPQGVVARRQHRRVRRRPARLQVRRHQALRARARGGAADRRDHPHRLEGGEERRRVRPHAAAGRLGGHAGDHHEDDPAAGAQAAGRRDAARLFCRRAHGGARGLGADPAPRRAGDARAGRRGLARRRGRLCRDAPGARRHRRAAAGGGRRRGRSRRRRGGAKWRRRCREVGALEVLVARDAAEREQLWRVRRELSLRAAARSRRRRSTTTSSCRAGVCRSCSRWSSGCAPPTTCASRASATPATATST